MDLINSIIISTIITSLPLMGGIFILIFGNSKNVILTKISSSFVWLSFIIAISTILITNFDKLNYIFASLITFISGIVHSYSLRYMYGDRNFRKYFVYLAFLTGSALILAFADNLMLISASWFLCNIFLTLLMIHKKEWVQALSSGLIAFRYFILASVCFTLSVIILIYHSKSYSLSVIITKISLINPSILLTSLSLITIAAIIQAGCIPMHKWLIGSMNSPTPISAIMHAGIVNCGGLILAKFAPLYFAFPNFLSIIFVLGAISALVGTIWMLVQTDIKHKLGCSTIGQMGFMFMQVGAGLFASAIAHLCMHSLFKSTMFLFSGSALKEASIHYAIADEQKLNFFEFLQAICLGFIGAYIFTIITGIKIDITTKLIQLIFVYMMVTQVVLVVYPYSKIAATLCCIIFASLYSVIILGFETILPEHLNNAQPLSFIHIIVTGIFIILWLYSLQRQKNLLIPKSIINKLYLIALNTSMSPKSTITTYRNNYYY